MPIKPENKKLYPPKAEWRRIQCLILQRENNRCKFCKCQNRKPHPLTGAHVVLTIAHLNHDPTDNRLENLAALCQKCHNAYDAPMRQQHRKETVARKERERREATGQGRLIE